MSADMTGFAHRGAGPGFELAVGQAAVDFVLEPETLPVFTAWYRQKLLELGLVDPAAPLDELRLELHDILVRLELHDILVDAANALADVIASANSETRDTGPASQHGGCS